MHVRRVRLFQPPRGDARAVRERHERVREVRRRGGNLARGGGGLGAGRRRRGVGVGAARRRRVHRAASASVQRFAVRQREGGERAQGADRGRRGDGGASRDACARGHRGQSEVTDEVANARRARERGGRRARATHRRAYYRRPAHDGDRGHVRARAGECGRRAAETRDERDAATDANDARRCLGFKRLS